MRTLLILLVSLLRSVLALTRSREEQAIVELALRQQLAIYDHDRPRPRLSPFDRTFWVMLSRIWPRWKDHLVVVRPETVVRWLRFPGSLVPVIGIVQVGMQAHADRYLYIPLVGLSISLAWFVADLAGDSAMRPGAAGPSPGARR